MKKAVTVAALLSLCFSAGVQADEGMWTFDNFPAAAVKAKYGVTIDAAWLNRVRAASVRLSSGCSASVVSKDGLVLTNHHCVRDCAQNLSTPQKDYVKDGFSAPARADEKLCAGMQAEILTDIADVTARVSGAAAGKTGQEFVKARDAEVAAIEKTACARHEDQSRCQVIGFYQGGQYKLYTYRKYSDVRLVFAPELQTAFFGGDPDNFNFPRYDVDFSFVRLYENNKPVVSPANLRWSPVAPREGEVVFVAGNPGSTQRLLTAEQLDSLRNFTLPETLLQYSEARGRLIRFGEESPERARIADDELFGIENSFKALHGEEQTLAGPGFIEAKRKADAELKAKVAADATLAQAIGDPWDEIAKAQVERKIIYTPFMALEARAGFGSSLFSYARVLVRAAAERDKPNGERLPEYTDSRLRLLEKRILDAEPVYPDMEQAMLEFWLSKLRENLTVDAPATKVVLGTKSPETLAAELAASKLGDPDVRKVLWTGGAAAVAASTDPMIRFARAIDESARAVRKDYEARVTGPTDRAAERIAKARFAVYGTNIYPDATFSLRLSYGKVEGWTDNGITVQPFTYMRGLWDRATGQPPFDLAPQWLAARTRMSDDTVVDIATDNDIIGGNSGSPLIDAKGDVVGAIFDGNIESLGGAFAFDDSVNRAVSVSTAVITEALTKVYNATGLVKELNQP